MIREINYVLAVNEYKSFSKAAKSLYISQPALSATIKKLETELGCALFDRSCSPIRLTRDGEFYVKSAQQILGISNNMSEYFENLKSLEEGSLTIGTTTFYCCYSLPIHLNPFLSLHPGIKVDLLENAGNPGLLQLLKSGDADMVLSINSSDFDGYERQFFAREHLILAVPASYEINDNLMKYRLTFQDIIDRKHLDESVPRVSLKKFKSLPFLALRPGNDLYERSLQMFNQAGISPDTYMFFDQIPTTYFMALHGYGFTIIRDTTLGIVPPASNDKPEVYFYKIDDPLSERNVSFYYKSSLYLPPAVQSFLEYTSDTCKISGDKERFFSRF